MLLRTFTQIQCVHACMRVVTVVRKTSKGPSYPISGLPDHSQKAIIEAKTYCA